MINKLPLYLSNSIFWSIVTTTQLVKMFENGNLQQEIIRKNLKGIVYEF